MNEFLSIQNLSVSYGAVNALRSVSMSLAKGTATGLIGPNGAGKTSLLHAIARDVSWSGGNVAFQGKSLTGKSPEQVVRMGVALVPENREVFTKLTVHENLLMGASIRSDPDGISSDLERMLQLFPRLNERITSFAGSLSGGEQQMLAIGRALMSRPDLLLLDEPSLGLAPVVTDTVYEVIANLKENGVTIVVVEQNPKRALSVCDDFYLLSAGEVDFHGAASQLAEGGDVEAAYFGTDELTITSEGGKSQGENT